MSSKCFFFSILKTLANRIFFTFETKLVQILQINLASFLITYKMEGFYEKYLICVARIYN